MSNKLKILTRTLINGQPLDQSFTKPEIFIGKGLDNDMIIEVPGVSRKHARLFFDNNALFIEDLGSTNGTFVNGQRLTGATVITQKDTVSVGHAEFRAKFIIQEVAPIANAGENAAPMENESTPVDDRSEEEIAAASKENAAAFAASPIIAESVNKPAAVAEETKGSQSSDKDDDETPRAGHRVLEVSLFWDGHLMAVNHYKPQKPVYIGEAKKVDFKIESLDLLGTLRFPFLVPENDGFILQITEDLALTQKNKRGDILATEIDLRQNGKLQRGQDPATPKAVWRYAINNDDRLTVTVGQLNFEIRYVAPAKFIPLALSNSMDFYFTKIVGVSLVAHVFLALALLFTPQLPQGLNDELFQNPDRFANLIITPPPVKKNKDEFKLEAKIEKARTTKTENKEKERFGKIEDKKVVVSGKKGPAVDLDKRERDQKRAMNSGIFSALKGSKGASSVFSGGGLGAGINNAVATIQGPSQEDAGGMGGLGSRGSGGAYGGGGLGIGGLGSGITGGGGGGGKVGLAGREKSSYTVASGRTRVEGGLTQAEVAKVLQKAQGQIRYCYEKELQTKPNLDGKIVTIFKIGPNGRVIQYSIGPESTLDDNNVKSCVLKVIQQLIFPNPRGGGIVDVNYPWLFKRSG